MSANRVKELSRISRHHTRLLGFVADIDFEQDIHHPFGPVLLEEELEPIADLRPINGVDHIKDLERDFDFVALERSDEVPPCIANPGFLGSRFLDAILPEITGARSHGLIHDLGRVGF